MDISLKGKTAVVCGSSQGIGLAVAQELAGLGATCILLARNEKTLKGAVAQLPAAHQQQHGYRVADFSEPEQVGKAANEISRETSVHILVNNTGGPAAGPIIEADEKSFLAAFSQHIVCNQLLVKAFFPAEGIFPGDEIGGLWKDHQYRFDLCENTAPESRRFQYHSRSRRFLGPEHGQ